MVLGIYNILKLLLIMTLALRNDRSCVIIIITILLFWAGGYLCPLKIIGPLQTDPLKVAP